MVLIVGVGVLVLLSVVLAHVACRLLTAAIRLERVARLLEGRLPSPDLAHVDSLGPFWRSDLARERRLAQRLMIRTVTGR